MKKGDKAISGWNIWFVKGEIITFIEHGKKDGVDIFKFKCDGVSKWLTADQFIPLT